MFPDVYRFALPPVRQSQKMAILWPSRLLPEIRLKPGIIGTFGENPELIGPPILGLGAER
jgi:hypothetical protein